MDETSRGQPLEPRAATPADDAAQLRKVAHDLNNVLSVMLIYGELIERAVTGRAMDEYIAEIRTAADHGAELTDELRTMARRYEQVAPTPDLGESAEPRQDEEKLLHAIRAHSPTGTETVGVVLVDDQRMFTDGLVRLLGLEPDIEVLAVGSSGREAVTLVEQHRPRVLLLDVDMPGGNGLVAAAEVKQRWPSTMVVMVTGSHDDRLLLRAIDAGCSGYLTKDRAASEVAAAVRAVAAGEALVSPDQMERLLPRLTKSRSGAGADLTGHERKVLELLARGATTAAIGLALLESEQAARDDVAGVLDKLGAHSKLEAVATAIREGVIEYNSPFG